MSQPTSRLWCCIDAEGDTGERGLIGAAFYSDVAQVYLTDHAQIRELLENHAESGYTFITHNANYDIPVIFWQLNIPVRIIMFNRRFNRGEWKLHPTLPTTEIWDTVGLSGGLSLHDLGRALHIPKWPTPESLTGNPLHQQSWTCDTHQVRECIECYALRDAEIPYKFMIGLESQLSTWGIRPERRLAGISMALWKRLDPRPPIAIRSKPINALGREAYHGGMVITFKLGHVSPCYAADICSSYPARMLETAMPSPESMVYRENMSGHSVPWDKEGVADVTVHVPEMYIPPLPYIDNGLMKWPVGLFRTQCTLLELRYAMQLGCEVRAVHRIAFGSVSTFPFTNFINTLWQLRMEHEASHDPRALLDKLLMNNLYGRIGMRDALTEQAVGMTRDRSTPSKGFERAESITTLGESYTDRGERHFSNKWANVLWAAQITAAGRVALHRFMLMQGGNMVYSDTDSIFSMAPINGLGEGLGALRDPVELKWMYVAQPKLYAYETVSGEKWAKAKGIRRDLALQFIRDGAVDIAQPVRPLDMARRKVAAGTWIMVHKERGTVAHRREPYRAVSDLGPEEWTDTRPPVVG